MAKKDKQASGLAPAPRPAKVAYKAALHIPAGNPDRHVVRVANRTWLVVQPGNPTFIGSFATKEKAADMAERHCSITKGQIKFHG